MRVVGGEATVGKYDIEPQVWCMVGKQLNVLGGRESAVSPEGSRLRVRMRRASVAWIASASLGTNRCGITEVNQEPGPSTTQSAASTTSMDSGHAGGSWGIRRTEQTSPGVLATRACPDLGDLVWLVRLEPDHIGRDVQRHRGHRQHPSLRPEKPGQPCPDLPPDRPGAPTVPQ